MPNEKNLNTIPVGTLGLIPLESCASLGQKVNQYLTEWRAERSHAQSTALHFSEYSKDSYIVKAKNPRFGSGEAKGVIEESVRGCDLYLMVDVCNYSQTYSLCGYVNHMSPDDHYQDLKRIIAAVEGKARRINVIMPFLYESRQHKRTSRESLDCAMALQELTKMHVFRTQFHVMDLRAFRVYTNLSKHCFVQSQICRLTMSILWSSAQMRAAWAVQSS